MNYASVADAFPHRLFAEQVKLLYGNASLAYTVTLVNGAILAYVQSTYVPLTVLLGWYGVLALVTLARASLVWRYKRMKPSADDAAFWNKCYVAGTAVAGCIWGATALLMFPPESAAHQVYLAFVLAGMSAGGISVLAPRMEACLAFLIPALLPLASRYLMLSSTFQMAMGVMTLIFFVGMVISAKNFHRAIYFALATRFDNQELEAEIARRRRVEEQLFQEKERLQTTVSSIAEGVALIDAEGRIEYLNPAAEQLCGRRFLRVMHFQCSEVFECFNDRYRRVPTAMEDCLQSGEPQKKQSIIYGKEGNKYVIEELATPLFHRDGKLAGAVSVFRDVTEAMQLTEQLLYAADHDVLTGLPNRNLLKDRTQHAIARAQRKQEGFGMLFLDLDRFKTVNDSMGHASGDALLIDVARRLTECVREEDTIARLGGDEFVVLLDGTGKQNQVDAIADKILNALREPFQLGANTTTVTASIGSSVYPNDGQDTESLLGHADAAMYRAKQMGRNRRCR